MGYALLFAGGADVKQMLLLGVVLVALFVLFAVIEPYRFQRLTTFTDPWNDGKGGLGSGYQLIQSFYALGSGGLFGLGLNNSRQKLLYMTYGESDFIFAILGEELGFVGAVVVMCAYGFIIYRGIRVALRCRDRFGSLLAAGITVVFALQVFVNIGVVTGSMPTTGQAQPFISAGGSSMISVWGLMAFLKTSDERTYGARRARNGVAESFVDTNFAADGKSSGKRGRGYAADNSAGNAGRVSRTRAQQSGFDDTSEARRATTRTNAAGRPHPRRMEVNIPDEKLSPGRDQKTRAQQSGYDDTSEARRATTRTNAAGRARKRKE